MSHPFIPGTSRLLYGADYNPEQWPESVWREDMRLMREAGVNLVSIGIFSWARLQSAPGVFHFEWLDRLMDLLAENGIGADLATPTASPPAWLVTAHPDILPTTAEGQRLYQGSRGHYNPSSQAYRRAGEEIVTALAQRYKDHPALLMWHIHNEYACHLGTGDYGDESAAAFRKWLEARYGSLDELNAAWGTAFWSQHYYTWEEILPPRATPSLVNPSQKLDFHRFTSDAFLGCYLNELRILRQITPDKPVTTNFMECFKPLDYRKWAANLDFTCLDVYPEPTGTSMPNAKSGDFMRSLKNGAPWMIMEQVTTAVNWRTRNNTKPPGLMRLWSYQSIAHGADGICFFQWRQSRAGAEKFHGAMVGHGEPAESQRCFREARQLGNELAGLGELAGSRVEAKAAIFHDHECWWALELPSKPNNDLKYQRGIDQFYRPLLEQNVACDFVFADSDLSRYKVIFAPALYMVKPGVAERLEEFVRAGGQLVVTYFSGIVDERDQIHLGGYPGPLRKLLGVNVEEWAVPAAGREFKVGVSRKSRPTFAKSYTASFWAEVVHLEGAEVVAEFTEDYYQGRPAVTRHALGQGAAWYVATDLEPAFYEDLARETVKCAELTSPFQVMEGVEIITRVTDRNRYLFVLNHNSHLVHVQSPQLAGVELRTRTDVLGDFTLPALGVAIIRQDR